MSQNKNKSIYDLVKSETKKQSTVDFLNKVGAEFNRVGNIFNSFGDGVFSTENFSESLISDVTRSASELNTRLNHVISDYSNNALESFEEHQREAAITSVMAAGNTKKFLTALESYNNNFDKNTYIIDNSIIGSGDLNVGRIPEALEKYGSYSMESYDEQENRNTMMYTFAYNLKAVRQNEFGEAFFPTVTLNPDIASATISVDLLSVMEEYRHSTSGTAVFNMNRKSLVLAIVNHKILNNETTRIYPIYRDTDAENKSYFVEDTIIPPWTETLENGETIKTSALKIGQQFSLLGLGSPDYLIGQNQLDFTDQIDPGVCLQTLWVKLKNGDVIKYDNLEIMPEAQFTYQVQGRNRTIGLTFELGYAQVTAQTLKIDGSPLTPIAATTNNYTVHLNLAAYGSLNTDDALTQVNAGKVSVRAIYDSSKNKLDLKTGPGKTAADDFEGAEIIGYRLYANRINTNRRERGQLLDLNRDRMVYNIPILAPISIVRPAIEDDAHYSARLDSLIMTTYIRCSNSAVSTLLSAANVLRSLPPVMEPELVYNSQVLGAARFFVTPYWDHEDLDVEQELNTLKSSDRILDVNAVLLNTIREMVFKAYLLSNYKAARDVLKGDMGDKKPTVIIGTDPYTAAYLQIIGDTRSLGDGFDFKIVTTPDERMRNQIFIAFGDDGTSKADTICNPLHFGNMFWRPELVSVLPISRYGQISKELTVQPSYRHVPHCPILLSIKVYNLDKAVKKMAPVFTKSVP